MEPHRELQLCLLGGLQARPVAACIEESSEGETRELAGLVLAILDGRYLDVIKASAETFPLKCAWGVDDDEELAVATQVRMLCQGAPGTQLRSLLTGVACLNLFVQTNWAMAAPLPAALEPVFGAASITAATADTGAAKLTIDGEEAYPCTYPFLLVLARGFLVAAREAISDVASASWWGMRCAQAHQSVLSENSETLQKTLKETDENTGAGMDALVVGADATLKREIVAKFHMERSSVLHRLWQDKHAKQALDEAQAALGTVVELTGVKGKRTKFQKFESTLIVLNAATAYYQVSGANNEAQMAQALMLPENCRLNDDVLLDTPDLLGARDVQRALSTVDQQYLMALVRHIRKVHPIGDEIARVELLGYLDRMLAPIAGTPRCWAVQIQAMHMRSAHEINENHQSMRALLQLEEIVIYLCKKVCCWC
jgi:hypothetical protein